MERNFEKKLGKAASPKNRDWTQLKKAKLSHHLNQFPQIVFLPFLLLYNKQSYFFDDLIPETSFSQKLKKTRK